MRVGRRGPLRGPQHRAHPDQRVLGLPGGPHTITAADPLPDNLRQALEAINDTRGPAH